MRGFAWFFWRAVMLVLLAGCECGAFGCGQCVVTEEPPMVTAGLALRPQDVACGATNVLVEVMLTRNAAAPVQTPVSLDLAWVPSTVAPGTPAGDTFVTVRGPATVDLPQPGIAVMARWRLDVAPNAPAGRILVTVNGTTAGQELVLLGTPGAVVQTPAAGQTCVEVDLNVAAGPQLLSNVSLEYQDGAGLWHPATLGRSPEGVLDRPGGLATRLTWDAARDGLAMQDGTAQLRVGVHQDLGAVGYTVFTVPVLAEQRGAFAPAVALAAGVNPSGVTAADVNGDGLQDVVVASHGNDQARVFLNQAGVGLVSSHVLRTGRGPENSAVADFNGDGRVDAALCNHDDDTVSIFYDVSLPAERPADQVIPTSINPYNVVAVDLDGDGLLDLLTANEQGDNLSILTNTGGGFANTGETPATGRRPLDLALGDLNGDGAVDVVVNNYGDDTVGVLLGNGAGGFGAMTTLVRGLFPESVAVADLDGDGVLDLIVNTLLAVNLSRGRGDGTFEDGVDVMAGMQPSATAVGDLDGDGAPDLAAVNSRSNNVTVLLNDGHGVFTSVATLPVGRDPRRIVMGHFNGDNLLDLVAVDSADATLSTLLATGTQRCARAVDGAVTKLPLDVDSMGAGDVDRDGHPDVVVRAANRVWLMRGLGGNVLAPAVQLDGVLAAGDVLWLAGAWGSQLETGLLLAVRTNAALEVYRVLVTQVLPVETLVDVADVSPQRGPGSTRVTSRTPAPPGAQRVVAVDLLGDLEADTLVVQDGTLNTALGEPLVPQPVRPDVMLGLDARLDGPATVVAWRKDVRQLDVITLPQMGAPVVDVLSGVDAVFTLDVDGDGVPGVVTVDLVRGVTQGEGRTHTAIPDATRATVVDLDGDGRPEVVQLLGRALRVWDGRAWEPLP